MKTEHESTERPGKGWQSHHLPMEARTAAVQVVTHADLAIGSLIPSLQDHFRKRGVHATPLQDLSLRGIRGTDLLVLPGCRGEQSPYRPEITHKLARILPDFLESGGHILGICAAGYHGSTRSTYQPPRRPHKEIRREGLSLVFGQAVGPLESYYLESGQVQNGIARPKLVPVTYTDKTGKNQTAAMPYHNGPWFEPEEDVEVIARYKETGKIAALRKWMGAGSVTLTGILADIDPRTAPLPGLDPAHRDALFTKLLAPALQER